MLDDFSIDHQSDLIPDDRTKAYFEEVKSSFTIGNYRSAVVMLWSVVVCDLIFKLQRLSELHGDTVAQKILDEVSEEQKKNPTSPAWEWNLVTKIRSSTGLLDEVDLKFLENLQSQRHLAAHPIIKDGAQLHRPNKDDARSLIRGALESVLTKPALVSKRILDQILADVANMQSLLAYGDELSKFLQSKYFSQFSAGVAESVFRSLWKLVFRVEDGPCEVNRAINFRVLQLIAEKEPQMTVKWITKELPYYSSFSGKPNIVAHLIQLLVSVDGVYPLLEEHAQTTIRHGIESNPASMLVARFRYPSTQEYFSSLASYLVTLVGPLIDSVAWSTFRSLWEGTEWQTESRKLANLYYANSGGFDTADRRFSQAIGPNLSNYTLGDLHDLVEKAAVNPQCYNRGRSFVDHKAVREQIQALEPQFDLSVDPYERFMKWVV